MKITESALEYIAKLSDGCMRQAIANLEKVLDYAALDDVLDDKNVLECLGSYSYEMFFQLVNAIIDDNEQTVLKIIEDVYNTGSDLKLFIDQFLNFCLDITKYAIFQSTEMVKMPSSLEGELKLATNFDNASKTYCYIIDRLLELKNMLKQDTNIKDTIEVYMLRIARFQ